MQSSDLIPSTPFLEVRVVVDGDATVVAVSGEVDLLAERQLTDALLGVIGSSDTVLVDLCECSFMDSAGLAALLTAARAAKERGVRFGVASLPGGEPRALFDMALGHTFWASSDDRPAGLAALRIAR